MANAVVVWGVVRWQAVAYRVRPVAQRVAGGFAVVAPAVAGVAMLLVGFHWLSDWSRARRSACRSWAWCTHSTGSPCHCGYVPEPAGESRSRRRRRLTAFGAPLLLAAVPVLAGVLLVGAAGPAGAAGQAAAAPAPAPTAAPASAAAPAAPPGCASWPTRGCPSCPAW